MTQREKLEEIKDHFKNMNNFGWPEDVNWLIARVKKLTEALDDIELCGINEQDEIKTIISKARGDE